MCSLKISINNKKLGWGNRGWLEIIFNILNVCEKQSLKTRIMNMCNLNSLQVEKYLDFLLNTKFISRKKKTSKSKKYTYKITAKGQNYLKKYKDLIVLFN